MSMVQPKIVSTQMVLAAVHATLFSLRTTT